MFTDGNQRKSADSEKVNCDTKTSKAELLKTCLENKITSIQHGLKEDLAKSVTRWLQGTTKTSPSSETKLSITNGSMNTKSKLSNNAINRKSSFGFGGKFEGDKYRQVNLADRLARVKSFQVNTDSYNQSWVPSLTSINRSLSLKKQNKTSTGSGSRFKRSFKLEKSNGNVLHEAKQHFKRDISFQVNKYDSWRNGINKGSLSLFIAISVILGLVIQCATITAGAPLPPSIITPIWLRDKLISLDLSLSANDEPNLPSESVSSKLNNKNQLEQLLHRIEDSAENQRSSSIPEKAPSTSLFNNLEESALTQQQQNQQGDHNVKESLMFDGNYNNNNEGLLRPVDSQGEELFWIERRRLERDRSLEPPPWLREQPMRRGFGPIESNSEFNVRDQSNRQLGTSASFKPQEAGWSQFGERTLGRKSRQSNDQIYEEILRYLLEEAHDNRPILDELYDELELRLKANQRPLSMASQQANIVSPLKSNDKQKSQRLIKQQGEQNQARNSDDSSGQDLLNSQPETSDAESTLVVVGDEVSSGDDATPLEDTSNLRFDNGISSYGNEDGVDKISQTSNSPINSGVSEDVGALTRPVLDLSKLTGSSVPDVYFAGPERVSNGALLVNVDPVSDSDEQLLQQIPNSNSFHVTEDIDQADNSQISTAYSTIDNDDNQTQQQQKVLEQTEFISSPSEKKRDYKFYPLSGVISTQKRQIKSDTAILQPYKQIPEDLQEMTLNLDNKNDASKPQQRQKYNITEDAIKLIESGYLNKEQLIWAATNLKYRLESALGLTKGTILGLYPMNVEQLLIKLDTTKITPNQIVSMIQNYDYARGFIVTNWPKDSQRSPLPILSSILRMLASIDGQNNDGYVRMEKEQALANQIQQQQQLDSASIVEQPAEPLYNYQQEANEIEFDPLASLSSSQWNARYFGQLSNENGDNNNNNKNEWEPEYSEVIELPQQASIPTTFAADHNLARLSHYMTGGAKNHHQSATTFAKPILVNQAAPSGQLPLDYLTAYLNAIYSGNKAASLQQIQNNGHFSSSSSSNNGGGGESLPWSSQAVRNLLTVAASFGGRPLVENLVANAYAAGNGNVDKIRQHLVSQKLTTSGQSQFESQASVAPNSNHLANYHLLHLFALLAAILGALFAIKIFIHSGDKQRFIRRRLTGDSNEDGGDNGKKPSIAWFKSLNFKYHFSTTTVGQVAEKGGSKEAGLNAASFVHRRLSNEKSDINSNEKQLLQLDLEAQQSGIAAKNFDLLTQKLVNLLNFKSDKADFVVQNQRADNQEEPKSDKVSINAQELDEASLGSGDIIVVESENGKSQRFRTSRSYIKSLIDALTKAKSQVSSGLSGNRLSSEGFCLDDDDEEQQATVGLLEAANKVGSKDSSNTSSDSAVDVEQQQEAGILTSQMDITAAHLILAYMEKHLEDKERLQREWRELNDNSSYFDCKSGLANSTPKQQKIVSKLANNTKVSQLMMQKLAKVALSDDNKGKNRNSSIVPYDRNRVKLSVPTATLVGASSVSSNTKIGHQKASSGNRSQAVTRTSDYINASYIYDDDPRMPTHIIAQGPTEQTLGAFWQMVWEQRVSVIVMLTRLNENSSKMCHCYWPTNSVAVNVGAAVGSSSPAVISSASPSSKMSSSSSNLNTESESFDKKKQQQQQQQQPASSSNSPLLQAGAEATALMNASNNNTTGNNNNNNGGSNSGAQRRSSVTSVFNSCEARAALNGGNNLPIIANGALNNNVLCFEIISSPLNSSSSSSASASQSSSLEHEIGSSDNVDGKTANNFKSKASMTSAAKTTSETTTSVVNQKATRFEVHLVSEHVSSSDYLVRNMYMINRSTGETRTITQFHYLAWPECGVPDNVKSFLQFRRKVHKSYRNLKSPILVHCSDGAGRSGTYTLIDIILERIKNGAKEIDPRATLEHLRDQRVGLCATQKQFEFVLVALAEEIQIILNALPH